MKNYNDILDTLIMSAMKEHDEVRIRTLRAMKAKFTEWKTAKQNVGKAVRAQNSAVQQNYKSGNRAECRSVPHTENNSAKHDRHERKIQRDRSYSHGITEKLQHHGKRGQNGKIRQFFRLGKIFHIKLYLQSNFLKKKYLL